jgi:hypothetical protein
MNDMPEFIVPGEDDASVFPEYFENGKLKPEYQHCRVCGEPGGELCVECLAELEAEWETR